MKKRKLELAIVFVVAVLVATFLRVEREPETVAKPTPVANKPTPMSQEPGKLPAVDLPKAELSEDAKWIISTAADSYAPRVPVEKAWEEPQKR